jgi:Protein of unknown function (DUF2799)
MRWVLLALALSACAGLDPEGCRRANWYDIGFRDAIFGLQRQDDIYALQCEPHGVKVDVARYAQGWREGKYEADQRRSQSHD